MTLYFTFSSYLSFFLLSTIESKSFMIMKSIQGFNNNWTNLFHMKKSQLYLIHVAPAQSCWEIKGSFIFSDNPTNVYIIWSQKTCISDEVLPFYMENQFEITRVGCFFMTVVSASSQNHEKLCVFCLFLSQMPSIAQA